MSTPLLTYSQSSDGKKLIFTDATTYTDPIGNYSRTVQLYSGKDATGSLLATLTFIGAILTVEYAITADQYWSAKLIHTGSPSIGSVIINFVSTRNEYNSLFKMAKSKCNCVSNKCSPLVYGFVDTYLAQVATDFGDSGLANNLITSAATWLNSNR